jgi:parvin
LGFNYQHTSGQQLDVIEVTQNEDLQKYKLRVVLETTNRLLGLATRYNNPRWSVEGVHNKNLVELTHLLVALIRHYRAPIRLPENVFVNVNVVQVIFLNNKCIGSY